MDAPIRNATLPIAALAAHPRNYRRHPDEQLAKLEASLLRFGQVRSVVVQEGAGGRYLIVAGHGLVRAAERQGVTELRADVIPATWTADQVAGYLVADNETAKGADDDLAALAHLLEEQANAGYSLESLGSSREELDALLSDLADSEDAAPPTFKDYDESIEDDLPTEMCQQCGKLCLRQKREG